MVFIFWFPSFLFWLLWLLLWSVFYVVRQWHYYVLCWPVPCSAALYYIAVLYLVVCNRGMSFCHFFLICALANQLALSCTLSPSSYVCGVCVCACYLLFFFLYSLSLKEAVCLKGTGLSAICHHLTDSSIWYTNSICSALQATILITYTVAHVPFMCLFQEKCVTVCVCVRVEVFTLSSLLSFLIRLLFPRGPIL